MNFILYSPLEQFEYLTLINSSYEMGMTFVDSVLGNDNLYLDILGQFYPFLRYYGQDLNSCPTLSAIFFENYTTYLNNIPTIIIEGLFFNDIEWILQQFFIYHYFYSKIATEFWSICTLFIIGIPHEIQYNKIIAKDPLFEELAEILYNDLKYVCQMQFPTINMGFIQISELINGEIKLRLATSEELAQFSKEAFVGTYWLNLHNSFYIVMILFVLIFIIGNTSLHYFNFGNIWTFLIDLIMVFLFETYISLTDKRLLKYFPLFVTLFIFILLSNLTALVPSSFCLTSNLWFSLTLSLFVWVGVTVLAIVVRGKEFFTAFVPSNVPPLFKPFLTIIEIISYIARAISLGVRIFANMLAGHSLIHILSDISELCFIATNCIGIKIFAIFPAIILVIIVFIEFGICFLQALVFVILTAIYLNEAFGYNSH